MLYFIATQILQIWLQPNLGQHGWTCNLSSEMSQTEKDKCCVCLCVYVCVCSCLVVSDSLQLHGSSVHGILQARILEWGAISFSRKSSQPRDWIQVSCIAGIFFTIWATKEAQILYDFTYMWNLKKKQMNKQNRAIDTEKKQVVARGEGFENGKK